jgi:hypothetical protein
MKICIHVEEVNLYNLLNKPVYEYYKTKLKAFVVIKGVTHLLSQQVMSVQSQVHHFGNLCFSSLSGTYELIFTTNLNP